MTPCIARQSMNMVVKFQFPLIYKILSWTTNTTLEGYLLAGKFKKKNIQQRIISLVENNESIHIKVSCHVISSPNNAENKKELTVSI